jgi:hypothetical protein
MPLSSSLVRASLACLSSGGLLLSLVACAAVPAAPTGAAAAADAPASAASGAVATAPAKPGAASAPAAAPAPAPGSPPAFSAVIKDARRSDGLLAVWQ